jgi:hypothetical protein
MAAFGLKRPSPPPCMMPFAATAFDVGLVLVPVVGKEVDWIAVGHLTIAVETDDECSNLSARDSLEGIEARHGHPVDDTLVMEAVDGVTGFV